jgi:hypothetical protein
MGPGSRSKLILIQGWTAITLPSLLLFAGCKEDSRQLASKPNSNEARGTRNEIPPSRVPAIASVDWSKSNSVSIVLGDESEYGGLKHNDKERDGITTIVKVDTTPCRLLNHKPNGRGEAFLYFSIEPAFKATGATNVRVDVEYFDVLLDERPTSFGIHYDAAATGSNIGSRYRSAGKTVMLTGANRWMTTAFFLRNAAFKNGQNGQSDFRIYARPPDLYVRRVTVTRMSGPTVR